HLQIKLFGGFPSRQIRAGEVHEREITERKTSSDIGIPEGCVFQITLLDGWPKILLIVGVRTLDEPTRTCLCIDAHADRVGFVIVSEGERPHLFVITTELDRFFGEYFVDELSIGLSFAERYR